VPSPQAHVPDEAGRGAARESPYRATPVGLDDIDRLLEESSSPATRRDAPVRAWRDDLALVLEALRYARAVLAGDVAILRHALAASTPTWHTDLVRQLPSILGARSEETGWADQRGPGGEPDLDLDVVIRADDLVSAHGEMAGLDLSDAAAVTRVLDLVEDTLVAMAAYQAAVELRLREIRAVILRQYVENLGPSRRKGG
jgi:hypothetical protein